jgi:glyoxylase-like metal-dependent hydrolase (beta-lactamase superfamily II)
MRDLYMQEKQQFEERKALGRPDENPYARAEFVTPDLGFDGVMTIQLANITFQLTEEGHGHSTSDVTMFVPQKRVFFMGDLLNTEIHPGQSESAGIIFANVNGWIASLDRIMNRNLPVDTYIPGHGPLHKGRGVADLEEQKRYFVTMRDRVSRRMAQGDDLETIRKTFDPPKEFSSYKRTERLNNFLNLFFHQNIERGY